MYSASAQRCGTCIGNYFRRVWRFGLQLLGRWFLRTTTHPELCSGGFKRFWPWLLRAVRVSWQRFATERKSPLIQSSAVAEAKMQFRRSEDANKNARYETRKRWELENKTLLFKRVRKIPLISFGRHGTQRLPTEKKLTETMQPMTRTKRGKGGERKRKEHRPARR